MDGRAQTEDGAAQLDLSVVIPAHNEAERIAETIRVTVSLDRSVPQPEAHDDHILIPPWQARRATLRSEFCRPSLGCGAALVAFEWLKGQQRVPENATVVLIDPGDPEIAVPAKPTGEESKLGGLIIPR